MLKMRRICIPICLDCNLHCKYCYRDLEKIDKIPDFTSDMIQYLQNLDSSWCEAVIASGGEPLLHWDKVIELFSYVPFDVHKVILTNGTLLNQSIIDYINENNVEVSLSHDGKMTEFLRGYDPFNNNDLLNLIKRIKILRINTICTKYNNDVWENFFYIISKLGREDIYYDTNAVADNNLPNQQFLIEGFDYELFVRTLNEFKSSDYFIKNPYRKGRSLTDNPLEGIKLRGGFDILPNGIVCGMTRINSNYGNIYTETYDELNNNLNKLGQRDKCLTCEIKDDCEQNIQYLSDHFCHVRKELHKYKEDKSLEYTRENTDNIILPIIEEKYKHVK